MIWTAAGSNTVEVCESSQSRVVNDEDDNKNSRAKVKERKTLRRKNINSKKMNQEWKDQSKMKEGEGSIPCSSKFN